MEQNPAEIAPLNPEGHNLPAAVLAGGAAAAIGAVLWAAIAVVTGVKIGWVAVGIGFLVGYAVRIFGKGSEPMFQVLGAVLSLLGCLAGNLLVVCVFVSRQEQIPLLALLANLNPSLIIGLMVDTFTVMDLLFYGIAIYEGYRFSRTPAGLAARMPGLSA